MVTNIQYSMVFSWLDVTELLINNNIQIKCCKKVKKVNFEIYIADRKASACI